MEIPKGYVGFIKDRSSLAKKFRLRVNAGVIDSDYRDDVRILIENNGDSPFAYEKGDRLAQIVILKHYDVDMFEVEKLDETSRTGGFGSTGK